MSVSMFAPELWVRPLLVCLHLQSEARKSSFKVGQRTNRDFNSRRCVVDTKGTHL